jgi:hypothetical protein
MLLEDRNAVSYGPGGAVDGGAAAAAAQRGGVCSPCTRRPGTMAGFRDRHRPPCRGAGDVPGRRTGGARHIGVFGERFAAAASHFGERRRRLSRVESSAR